MFSPAESSTTSTRRAPSFQVWCLSLWNMSHRFYWGLCGRVPQSIYLHANSGHERCRSGETVSEFRPSTHCSPVGASHVLAIPCVSMFMTTTGTTAPQSFHSSPHILPRRQKADKNVQGKADPCLQTAAPRCHLVREAAIQSFAALCWEFQANISFLRPLFNFKGSSQHGMCSWAHRGCGTVSRKPGWNLSLSEWCNYPGLSMWWWMMAHNTLHKSYVLQGEVTDRDTWSHCPIQTKKGTCWRIPSLGDIPSF